MRSDWSWKEQNAPRQKRYGRSKKKRGPKLPRSVKKWFILRAKVLKAYGSVCMRCGSTEDIEVDHIKPRSKFPELRFDFDNLQVLCRPCNLLKLNYHCTDYRTDYFARELDLQLLAEFKDWL